MGPLLFSGVEKGMKVIKSAVTPKPIEHTCVTCHAVLEVEISDCTYNSGDQRDGNFWTCRCPECNAQFLLNAGEMLKRFGWNPHLKGPKLPHVGRDPRTL